MIVQVPTGNVVLEKLMLEAPALAVTLPPQLLTTLGELATNKLPPALLGRLSVKLASTGITFPLVRLKVIVLNAPGAKFVL